MELKISSRVGCRMEGATGRNHQRVDGKEEGMKGGTSLPISSFGVLMEGRLELQAEKEVVSSVEG